MAPDAADRSLNVTATLSAAVPTAQLIVLGDAHGGLLSPDLSPPSLHFERAFNTDARNMPRSISEFFSPPHRRSASVSAEDVHDLCAEAPGLPN